MENGERNATSSMEYAPHIASDIFTLQQDTPATEEPFRITMTTLGPGTTMPVIGPALTAEVELSLTIVYIIIFGLLFALVYIQLWMIWYYRHKRLSHQTLFLYMCLVWAGLRTTLFSFYFHDCKEANMLSLIPYWLLYCLPVCLQFSMLCLLLHFFAQVVLKARAKSEPRQYKVPLRLFLSASVLAFVVINVIFAWLTRCPPSSLKLSPLMVITIRVGLTESMFFLYGCLLSVCIFQMTKTIASHRVLEAKGTTVCTASLTCILITLLFLSRAIYNVITVCPIMRKSMPNFGNDWVNVTDQADVLAGDLSHGLAYVSFGAVLFLWEVLPTSIVVIFFRVKRRHVSYIPADYSQYHNRPRVFFFDNPRRYDSEDDLLHQQTTHSPYREITNRHSLNGEGSHSPWLTSATPNNNSSWIVPSQPYHNSHPRSVSNSIPAPGDMGGGRPDLNVKRSIYGSIESEEPARF